MRKVRKVLGVPHEIHKSDVRFTARTRYCPWITEDIQERRTDVMRTSPRISLAIWALAATGWLLGSSGCGGSSKESADAAHSSSNKAAAHSHGPVDPSQRSLSDMVAAVSAGKGGPPVGLKFELRGAPRAGEQLDVDIAILPDAPAINRVYGRFQAGDGLELVDGSELAAVDKPAQGAVIRHVLHVLPKQDGIFTLSAAVSVELADDSVTRTFTIPVIVGEGLADSSTKSDDNGKDAAAGIAPKAR